MSTHTRTTLIKLNITVHTGARGHKILLAQGATGIQALRSTQRHSAQTTNILGTARVLANPTCARKPPVEPRNASTFTAQARSSHGQAVPSWFQLKSLHHPFCRSDCIATTGPHDHEVGLGRQSPSGRWERNQYHSHQGRPQLLQERLSHVLSDMQSHSILNIYPAARTGCLTACACWWPWPRMTPGIDL